MYRHGFETQSGILKISGQVPHQKGDIVDGEAAASARSNLLRLLGPLFSSWVGDL